MKCINSNVTKFVSFLDEQQQKKNLNKRETNKYNSATIKKNI